MNAQGLQFPVSSILMLSHTNMFPFCPGNVAFSSYNKEEEKEVVTFGGNFLNRKQEKKVA